MKPIIITESEKSEILRLHNFIEKEIRPFQKLMEAKFSLDGKYVMVEGLVYSCDTGDVVNQTITEGWSISDILHTGADLLSMGLDFVIPGSGAIVDTLNAISYIIEAQFKPAEQRDSFYIMAAITFGFVVLPGPLQAIAPVLKRAVKTGKGLNSKPVRTGLQIIGNSLSAVLGAVQGLVRKALESPLAKRILGKWGKKLGGFISNFYKRVTQIFDTLKTKAGATKKSAQELGTKASEKLSKGKNLLKTTGKELGQLTISKQIAASAQRFFAKLPKIKKGSLVLRKLGFAPGKSYRFVKDGTAKTVKLGKVEGETVFVYFGKNPIPQRIDITDFVKNSVGAPWGRRGFSTTVPFFIKRFSSEILLPDGSDINYAILDSIPDANPDQTSAESLAFMGEEVGKFEGESGAYTVQSSVKTFQDALELLGYKLSKFGADGKFGAETLEQLKKFQTDNGLTTSLGKMDRLTARKLAALLKSKNISGSEELQNQLNKI
jgi:peptidoglycan hydrolase-like protein with peptidoglycan-binding domain